MTAKYKLDSLDLSSDLAKYYFRERAMSVFKRFQVVLNQVVLEVPKYELKQELCSEKYDADEFLELISSSSIIPSHRGGG